MKADKMAQQGKRTAVGWLVPLGIVTAGVLVVVAVAMVPSTKAPVPEVELPPTSVLVETVRAIDQVEETFDLPGSVEPNRVVKVAGEVSGRIESYGARAKAATWQGRVFAEGQMIDEGEPIEAGDVLVQLNRDILLAEVERADAQHRYERSELKRLGGMQASGATTARELSEAEMKTTVAEAALKIAREQLGRTSIRSPIRGIVNRMPREVGEFVQPGMEVAEIVEIDPAKVVVDVPERDVPHLSVGDEAQVFVEVEGQPLSGRITYISELADAMTRSSRVEITIANAEHRLRSGQIVRVRLTRGLWRNVVMIPLKAIIPLEQGYQVFVARQGVAESRRISLGFIRQDRVMVSGLEQDDQLIVQGHRLVSQGQRVQVTSATDSKGAGDSSRVAQADLTSTVPADVR